MAISRHKVLSEMQQQLELASSKCGNLQKQLEIVKDKVRQSSTTNLGRTELPENKENKSHVGESHEAHGTNRETDYSQALSTSSSSSEETNEERDVNIIKVFYDRLGQMDYPKGQVELSDISSLENDGDIDQLLSSVNFSVRPNERKKGKRGKKVSKKGENKTEKSSLKEKIGVKNVSPYLNNITKVLKQTPTKKRIVKLKVLKASNSQSGTTGNNPASRGPITKVGIDKTCKKKQTSGPSIVEVNRKKIFQEPIKRVMNLASQLRKTKSSTIAEKKETFADTRSLTQLLPEASTVLRVDAIAEEKDIINKNLANRISKDDQKHERTEKNNSVSVNILTGMSHRGQNRMVRNDPPSIKKENFVDRGGRKDTTELLQQDKGTSLSDLAMMTNTTTKLEAQLPKNQMSKTNARKSTSPSVGLISRIDTNKRSFDAKVPNSNVEKKEPVTNPWLSRKPPGRLEKHIICQENELVTSKNEVIPYPRQDTKPGKIEIKRRVDIFEKIATKDKQTANTKRPVDKDRPTSKFKNSIVVPRPDSSTFDDASRNGVGSLRPPSSNNTITSALQGAGDYKDKTPVDIKTMAITQIKNMKENLMKFNTIPFIVGQSTSKSYHIGLNIQETYSLFKQTPSMTAMMASRNVPAAEPNIVPNKARSTITGYSSRKSFSSCKGRESCPACEPLPERSPEQLADPWAVPQDENAVVRVCTCLPRRMISFDQVLNQLYFSNMNLIKLHPSFLPKNGINGEGEPHEGKEKSALLQPKSTNTLYYTKLLRSIQSFKENIKG